MEIERWNRLKDLFAVALERPASERTGFVQEACADDPELRLELLRLLQAEQVDDNFIVQPAADDLGWSDESDEHPWIGRKIGPYRIEALAGRGGLSRVYRAVQEGADFERQVAIKLLRPGFGGEALQRRFRAEGRMLAALSHPNIAHFLDAGATEDGTPYLVLEYVEGRPLDEYCDLHALPLEARIDLFRVLCGAVQYVHQHLMIHGDLKGSNVLVTSDGGVKLLDFGIARLLTPGVAPGQLTQPATLMLLTPDYASPEQLRGEPLTTASDVYSLGALLYRLLTGRTPYGGDRATPAVMVERMTTGSWVPPGVAAARTGGAHAAFARPLHGDLGTILRKTLKVDTLERYASVQQLADDLHRWQRGFPVEAQPDSIGYRVGKWARRHRATAVLSVLAFTALVGGIAATSWQAHQARLERERAERNFTAVRELSSVFLADVYSAIARIPGSTEARKLLVDNSLKYLQSLERDAKGSVELRRDLAVAYERLGDVQGAMLEPSLGDQQAAIANYRKSLAIRASVADEQPTLQNRAEVLRSLIFLVEALLVINDTAAAQQLVPDMVRAADQVAADPAADRVARRYVGAAYMTQGWMEWSDGKADAAVATLERSRAVYREIARAHPDDKLAQRDLAVINGRVGEAHSKGTGRLEQSLQAYEEALALMQPLLRADPDNSDLARTALIARLNIGELHNSMRRPRQALQVLEPALVEVRRMRAADPADQFAPFVLAGSLNLVGESHLQLQDFDAAKAAFEEAASIPDRKQAEAVPDLRLMVAGADAGLARAFAGIAGRSAGAARASALAQAERLGRQAEAWLAPLAQSPQTKIAAGRQLDALRRDMGWTG